MSESSKEDQALLRAFEDDGIVERSHTLSADEATILMIAARGEPMMPIGRWEKPVESLVAKGYLQMHASPQDPTGRFNCRITDLGRQALAGEETETDKALAVAINKSREIGRNQVQMIAEIELAARALFRAVNIAIKMTGDSQRVASQKILSLLQQKMLELLNG